MWLGDYSDWENIKRDSLKFGEMEEEKFVD